MTKRVKTAFGTAGNVVSAFDPLGYLDGSTPLTADFKVVVAALVGEPKRDQELRNPYFRETPRILEENLLERGASE